MDPRVVDDDILADRDLATGSKICKSGSGSDKNGRGRKKAMNVEGHQAELVAAHLSQVQAFETNTSSLRKELRSDMQAFHDQLMAACLEACSESERRMMLRCQNLVQDECARSSAEVEEIGSRYSAESAALSARVHMLERDLADACLADVNACLQKVQEDDIQQLTQISALCARIESLERDFSSAELENIDSCLTQLDSRLTQLEATYIHVNHELDQMKQRVQCELDQLKQGMRREEPQSSVNVQNQEISVLSLSLRDIRDEFQKLQTAIEQRPPLEQVSHGADAGADLGLSVGRVGMGLAHCVGELNAEAQVALNERLDSLAAELRASLQAEVKVAAKAAVSEAAAAASSLTLSTLAKPTANALPAALAGPADPSAPEQQPGQPDQASAAPALPSSVEVATQEPCSSPPAPRRSKSPCKSPPAPRGSKSPCKSQPAPHGSGCPLLSEYAREELQRLATSVERLISGHPASRPRAAESTLLDGSTARAESSPSPVEGAQRAIVLGVGSCDSPRGRSEGRSAEVSAPRRASSMTELPVAVTGVGFDAGHAVGAHDPLSLSYRNVSSTRNLGHYSAHAVLLPGSRAHPPRSANGKMTPRPSMSPAIVQSASRAPTPRPSMPPAMVQSASRAPTPRPTLLMSHQLAPCKSGQFAMKIASPECNLQSL